MLSHILLLGLPGSSRGFELNLKIFLVLSCKPLLTSYTSQPYDNRSLNSKVRLGAGLQRNRGLISGRSKDFCLFSITYHLAPESTQPSVKFELGLLRQGQSGRDVKPTTQIYIVPRLKWWSFISTPPYTLTVWCLIN